MSYVTITQIGGACPFQAEGEILGCPFYLRARHGEYRLDVVVPGACPVSAWRHPETCLVHLEGDDDTNGFMRFQEGMSIIGEALHQTWERWDMWEKKRRTPKLEEEQP